MLLQFGHLILLQPCSFIKGCWHLLHFLMRAADIASSTTCRFVNFPSLLASSQLSGICVSLLHNRQLVSPHFVFWQRNSLSTSTGKHSALKSQNGHSERKSRPAAARSCCCCMCSSRSKDFSPRICCNCAREKAPLHSRSAKHMGRHFIWPISVSIYCLEQSMQKVCMSLPLQVTIRLSGQSVKQHWHWPIWLFIFACCRLTSSARSVSSILVRLPASFSTFFFAARSSFGSLLSRVISASSTSRLLRGLIVMANLRIDE